MFQSFRCSNIFLRLGLAAVFLWFGIDKFIHPDYWLSAWVPQDVLALADRFGISGFDIVNISGVFELLVGASILSNIFIKVFSFLAILFLVSIIFVFGMNEVLVRDIGLVGGLLSLMFWPSRKRF